MLAVFIIGLTISEAMRRGMDHALAVSPGEEIAVAIALSDSVYGVHLGYVGLASVLHTIQAHWNKGGNEWANFSALVDNFHNRKVLNDGIHAAASLPPQNVGYFTNGSLITTIYDDMGEVDFVKLSFAIFGMKIESMFMMFFLLTSMSSITFILTFRKNVYALGLLLCTLCSFYIVLYLPVFDPSANPSFFGMRNASMLGFIPTWYLAFLLVAPRNRSPLLVTGTLLQVAILILAWRIRATVVWMLIFLILLSVVLAVAKFWIPRWQQNQSLWNRFVLTCRSWHLLLRGMLPWPVALILLGLLANGIYNQGSRHLIYSTDDVIPHHGLWWSVVRGLYETNPGLFSSSVKPTSGTPEGWWFLRDYFHKTHMIPWNGDHNTSDPTPGVISPWTAGPRYRLVDNAMERIFFETASRHPIETFRTIFYGKIPIIFDKVTSVIKRAPSNTWIWLIVAAAAGLFAFVSLFRDDDALAPLGTVILLSAGAVAAATLPNILAIIELTAMTDTFLLGIIFVLIALGLGARLLSSLAQKRRRKLAAAMDG